MSEESGFRLFDILKQRDNIYIPERFDTFDPTSFYVTSPGLVVRREFRSGILSFLETVRWAPKRTYLSSTFRREVISKWRIQLHDFGQWPDYSFSQAVDIAWLLNRQAEGERGFLCNGDCFNFCLLARNIWVSTARTPRNKAWEISLESAATVFDRLRSHPGVD